MKTSFLILLTIAFFTACQKDDVEKDLTPEPTENNQSANFLQLQNEQNGGGVISVTNTSEEDECFTINFPITVIFPDGTTQSFNSEEEVDAMVDGWLEENENADEFPELDFPIEVTLEDGTVQSISDDEALCELAHECWDEDDDWDDYDDLDEIFCFEFQYPMSINFPDGSTVEVNNDEELIELIIEWEDNYDGSGGEPTFVYPITMLQNGVATIINSDDGLLGAMDLCFEDFHEMCFDINYPVEVVFPDNTTTTVNTDNELNETVETWFDQNPNTNEEPTLTYPISVTFDDGVTTAVNSDDELETIFEECFGGKPGGGSTGGSGLIMNEGSRATTKAILTLKKSKRVEQKSGL